MDTNTILQKTTSFKKGVINTINLQTTKAKVFCSSKWHLDQDEFMTSSIQIYCSLQLQVGILL